MNNQIIIACKNYLLTADSTITVTRYEYIGYRNVWHDGYSFHKVSLLFLRQFLQTNQTTFYD